VIIFRKDYSPPPLVRHLDPLVLLSATSWTRFSKISIYQVVFYDNFSAIYITTNPIHHHRTKHIEINIHFICEKVTLGEVCVLHVLSSHQCIDIMTKGLPVQLYIDFWFSVWACEPLTMMWGVRCVYI